MYMYNHVSHECRFAIVNKHGLLAMTNNFLTETLFSIPLSVDVVPVVESAPSAQVPTLLTNVTTPHASHHHNNHHHHHHHGKGEEISDNSRDMTGGGDNTVHQNRVTESTLSQSDSHEILHNGIPNTDTLGVGSNTESQENLLDSHSKNCRNQKDTLEEKSNSGSKVADLINTYEETAKLSQSSSDSVKSSRVEGRGEDVEIVGKGRVARVMSMVVEQSYLQPPQTLVLHEVRNIQ